METTAQQDDPMLRLQYYKETGQPEEAKHYEEYLRETGQYHEAPTAPTAPQPPKKGLVQRAKDLLTAGSGAGWETAASSVPFVGPLLTKGIAAERSLYTGKPYREEMNNVNQDIAGFRGQNPRTALGLNVAGGYALPLGQLSRLGGAVLGGGMAAVDRIGANPDESLTDRLVGTAKATAIGAAAGYAAPFVMSNPLLRTAAGAGLGAYLAPQGAAPTLAGAVAGGAAAAKPTAMLDMASNLAGRLGATGPQQTLASLANATGTRGAVNAELEGIDKIAKPVGSMVGAQAPGASQKVAQAAQFEAQSKQLYDAAVNSPRVLNDPKTLAMVRDPDLAKAFGVVDQIRKEAGNALPQSVVGQQVVPSNVLQANGQPFTYTKPIMGSVPDPEGLHLLKRIIRDRVERGFSSDSPIPIEEALKLQPKVEALTAHLHTVSPEYQQADRFFQLASTAQEAANLGYGAAKPGMVNPAGKALGEKDVTGVRQFVADQGHADPAQDAALKAVASSGAQQGAQNQLAQQIAQRGVAGGRAGVLAAPGLALSGPAAEQRALALGSQAPAFENVLASQRSAVASQQKAPGMIAKGLSAITRGHVVPTSTDQAAKALGSAEGQRLLGQVVQDPNAYQDVLASFRAGAIKKQELNALLSILAGRIVTAP